jgi:hypothetical protein
MQRDSKGRFVKGNDVGKTGGRPKRVTERRYLEVMMNTVTEQHWEAITRRAIIDAAQGDSYARTWLSLYLIGKPAQTLNLNFQDMALLSELLKAVESKGMDASTLFAHMLNEIAVDAEYQDVEQIELEDKD